VQEPAVEGKVERKGDDHQNGGDGHVGDQHPEEGLEINHVDRRLLHLKGEHNRLGDQHLK